MSLVCGGVLLGYVFWALDGRCVTRYMDEREVLLENDERSKMRAPAMLKEMNNGLLLQRERGELPFELDVFLIRGRRSGKRLPTPLTVHSKDGVRYVVGGFPGSDWIKNVRASGGRAVLSGGVRIEDEEILLVELPPNEALPILRACPEVMPYGTALMVESGIAESATSDALAKLAGICPVFRLDTPPE